MSHTFLHGALHECEACGTEYEDHPLAFAPHLCPHCEELEGGGDGYDDPEGT